MVARQMVIPGMQVMFPLASPGEFDVTEGGKLIRNPAPIAIANWDMDGTVVSPVVPPGQLNISVGPTALEIDITQANYTRQSAKISLQMYASASIKLGANGAIEMHPKEFRKGGSVTVDNSVGLIAECTQQAIQLVGLCVGIGMSAASSLKEPDLAVPEGTQEGYDADYDEVVVDVPDDVLDSDLGVGAVHRPQLGNPVRVRQKSHVGHHVGIDWQAVLETEGQHCRPQRRRVLHAECRVDRVPKLMDIETRGVDDEIRIDPQVTQFVEDVILKGVDKSLSALCCPTFT